MTPFIRSLILTGSVALAVMILLLGFRALVDGLAYLRARRRRQDDLDVTVKPVSQGWRGQMDHGFSEMVRKTTLGMSGPQALALICLCGVILAGAAYLWLEQAWAVAVGLALGMLLPYVVLLFLQNRWKNRIQEQLPDALFLLARSTRAGLSLEQAVEAVGNHGEQPLAAEFHRAAEQTRLGLSVPTALQNTADRVQSPDVNALVSVVKLHRNMGGNLPQLLDRLAASVRDRNHFRGYFKAATALGKITAITLACIAPVIFLGYLFLQPDYVTKFAMTPMGLNALALALLLEIVGVVWLWMLLQIDY